MGRAWFCLAIVLAVFGVWLMIAEFLLLGIATTIALSAIGALVCLLAVYALPKWASARSLREYHSLLHHDTGRIVGKARYRNRRVLHYADGSVAGQAWSRMKSFRSFDDFRSYVDGR